MLPFPRALSSDDRILLYKLDEFVGALRHKHSFLPYDAELTGDLGTDRNLHKIPWVDRQNRVQQRAAGAAPQEVEDRVKLASHPSASRS